MPVRYECNFAGQLVGFFGSFLGLVVLILLIVFVYLLSMANLHVVCKKLPVINYIPYLWKKFTQPK
jgi:uncharacterized membrane protein